MLKRYLVEMIGKNGRRLHVGFVNAENVDDAKERLHWRRQGIEMAGPKVARTEITRLQKPFMFHHLAGGDK